MGRFAAIIRFNGRIEKGVIAETVDAESVGEALALITAKAVRSKEGGGSIFVTGITVDEIRS